LDFARCPNCAFDVYRITHYGADRTRNGRAIARRADLTRPRFGIANIGRREK
jgi:hypothetical protein